MAQLRPKFVAAGVRLVGGCCGTTPEHIRAMKVRPADERGQGEDRSFSVRPCSGGAFGSSRHSHRGSLSPGQEDRQRRIHHHGRDRPPKGIDIRKELEGARFLKSVGVDAINIPDSPRASARMSNQALSLLIQQEVGIEAILHYTCRDRNVLGIQSDLLGAAATGIRNLICITGDPPKMGKLSRRHRGV